MNKREIELKKISNEFAKWRVQIENLNSLNLYDTNLFSENSICNILNAIFDYKLTNINPLIRNSPAIDLIDKKNRIAVQVTSTNSKDKIQKTLDKFFRNDLNKEYDQLFIIILGTKQNKYSSFIIQGQFKFDPKANVIDFKDLLKFVSLLPTKRIEKISKLLLDEQLTPEAKTTRNNENKIKRNLALKKRLKKDLLDELDRKLWDRASYEPWIRFKYHNLVIRSVDDKTYPKVEDSKNGEMSGWFRGEVYTFYENGIELVTHGGEAIFDSNENWDILNWKGDKRSSNSKYEIIPFHTFLRIPYEYVVDYDMEPDPYYGVPTIYVKYAKDKMPYEEIMRGKMGHFEDDFGKCRMTYYFPNDKRKRLR
jgi:hypothetical protein